MKTFLTLILLVCLTLSTSSQTLKPQIQQSKNDTLLCFTLAQSRILANKLMNGQYADSIVVQQDSIIKNMAIVIQIKDSAIHYSLMAYKTQEFSLLKTNEVVVNQQGELKKSRRSITSLKVQRLVLFACVLVLGGSIILK